MEQGIVTAGIGAAELAQLTALIADGKQDRFYGWAAWLGLSEQVRRLDNHECQGCKQRGRYRRGEVVHHVKHLTERPDLALSIFDPDTGERQLVTLCRECHRLEHPEHLRQYAPRRKALTEERWD